MKIFVLTLRFLTRFSIPLKEEGGLLPDSEFAKGVVWFPLIGLIVGISSLAGYLLAERIAGGMFPAVFAVLIGIMVTGGFHLDGLADTCDGIFSSRKKEQMLIIMRDSRIGTNGALAVVFDILLKVSLIHFIGTPFCYAAVLLAPVAGKMATPLLFQCEYAREGEGLGNIYIGNLTEKRIYFTIFLGAFIILLLLGFLGVITVVITLLGMACYRFLIEKKIGGMTGDTLGAGCELCEVLFLVSLAFEGGIFY